MYIKCENPQIILHPYAVDRILQYGNYTIRGKSYYLTNEQMCRYYNYFPRRIIHPKALSILPDEIDDCYIVDDTGILHPLYLYVPCGKCILCKSKKVQDWQCRALCECDTSVSKPLWIGLSYNERWYPEQGVIKEDAQKFLKRLRIRLDRKGYVHNLRYFLCSEYGDDGRGHYHLLLFNFPHMSDSDKYLIIRDAWSRVVSFDEWNTFPEYSRFAHWKIKPQFDNMHLRNKLKNLFDTGKYDDMKPYISSIRYHVRIGFIFFDVCDGSDGIYRVKYCMKYMYKDTNIPIQIIGKYRRRKIYRTIYSHDDKYFNTSWIEYKRIKYGNVIKVRLVRKKYNDTFYLSSRKLAIGREWLEKNRKIFDDNVCLSTVKFRSLGNIHEFRMPVYFKNLLYPCISKLVKKEVRDKVKEFNMLLFDRYKLSFSMTNKTVPIYRDELELVHKFRCLPWFLNFAVHPKFRNLSVAESAFRCADIDKNKYNDLFNYLKSVDIDSEFIINMQMRKQLYTQNLIDFIRLQPEISISDLVNKRKKSRRSEKNRSKKLYKSENVY